MRKLLSFLSFFLLLAIVFGQTFPVKVSNPFSLFAPESYQGSYKTNAYASVKVARTAVLAATSSSIGNLYSFNAGFGPQAGKAAKIRNIVISSDKAISVYIRVGVPTGPLNGVNLPEEDIVANIPPSTVAQPTIIPVNHIIRNGQSCIFYVTRFLNSSDDTAIISAYPQVDYVSDDFNDNARKTIVWIGTSITNGTGVSATEYMYQSMMKEWLRLQGASVRFELYGISGSSSTSHRSMFNKGQYDITSLGTPPDIVVLELAVNDASAGVAVATTVANYTNYCQRLLNHPEKKDIRILVQGATPLQNTTAYNNAQALDSALNLMVQTFKQNSSYSNRISFVRVSNTFPRTTFSYYAQTDTNGSGIHPNDTGSPMIFTYGWLPWFTTTTEGQNFVTWVKK